MKLSEMDERMRKSQRAASRGDKIARGKLERQVDRTNPHANDPSSNPFSGQNLMAAAKGTALNDPVRIVRVNGEELILLKSNIRKNAYRLFPFHKLPKGEELILQWPGGSQTARINILGSFKTSLDLSDERVEFVM